MNEKCPECGKYAKKISEFKEHGKTFVLFNCCDKFAYEYSFEHGYMSGEWEEKKRRITDTQTIKKLLGETK